ncbi:MAG: diguanylate cyclase [Deltaproteobacteria bacterium]|nr:diguanylate cyclase [Deltaproteobacteria bacterium]
MRDNQRGLVLVVDDDAFQRALLKEILESDGHRVLVAGTGAAALQMLRNHAVDLVVLDLSLPDIHGLEILDRIRRRDGTIEVIICSASHDLDSVVSALRGRAADYLVKPVVPAVVQRAAVRALQGRTLLKENHKLRLALDLVQAGQRVLAAPDLRSVLEEVLELLCAHTNSSGGVVGVPGHETASSGLPEAVVAPALAAAAARGLASPDVQEAGDMAPIPDHGPGLFLALGPPGVVGALARADGAEPYEAGELESAQFLVRHAHLALHNHQRFAAATDAARRDSLTGLLNAQVLQAALSQAVARASQEGGHCAAVFLDLDGFKQVNDTLGHLMGSKLLVELAGLLGRSVRDGDVVSRFGGDEFVILLAGADADDAARVAERLRSRVDGHEFLLRDGHRARVSMSVGVAVFPQDAANAADLLHRADEAMYRAKRGGKNAVVRWKAS